MKSLLNKCILGLALCWEMAAVAKSQLSLPKPTGHYAVGTRAIELMDCSRTLLRSKSKKRLMVQAFYPAEPHGGQYPYMPLTLDAGIVENTRVLSWAKHDAAPLAKTKFPIIIFTPGRGAQRQQYTILLEELASQGYVVLALDQPYVANFVKFPNGDTVLLSLKDAWYVRQDRDYRYAYDDKVIEGAIGDIAYLLDHLDGLGDITQVCDPSHVILMGHSLGANIAHIVGFKDDRICAIVDIDSKITERKVFGRIGVPDNPTAKPVLFIRGALQYQEDVGDQLTKLQNATIWSPSVEHSAFSDNAFFAGKIPNFGSDGIASILFSWLFEQGPFWSNTDTYLGGKDPEAWVCEYRQYIVEWLESARQQIIDNQIKQIPVGDHLYAEVYTFIKDFLLKQRAWTPNEIKRLIDKERSLLSSDEINKPYTTDIAEGEVSGLLKVLCRSNKACRSLSLYQRNGVQVADGDASSLDSQSFSIKSRNDQADWGKDEINLGTLGLEPHRRLGLKTRLDQNGFKLQELIEVLYYNAERDYAYLAREITSSSDKIIGYVRYVFQ